jgi:nicotinate-nucleotide adenylyltransferase
MTERAVFGGSFDPPHVGHVLAAAWVLSTSPVDEILVIPTFEHVFGKRLTPFAHRLRMCELAFAPLKRVRVLDLEARLGGASATVRTLEALGREEPGVSLHLIVGSDLVGEIPRWTEGHRIPELASLLVVGRGGHDDGQRRDVSMPEISSTEIRDRLRRGESVEGLVPRAVIEHIAASQLYLRAQGVS